MKPRMTQIGLALFTLLVTLHPQALELEDIKTAISSGETKLNLRYRFEYVDQDGFSNDAKASTLRGRLTWGSQPLDGWRAGIEADYVALIGNESYNSTENGNTQFPVVADPEGFDLNQFYLAYKGQDLQTTIGRQRIVHADQRFVGGVAWRQNEQTYDAVRIQYSFSGDFSLDYGYIWNVNRIFGPNDGAQPADWRSNSHFLFATYQFNDAHKLDGFVYLTDFENGNGLPNSTSTYGLTYQGSLGPVNLRGTYAQQSDYADSPLDYDADFLAVNVGVKLQPVTLNLGYELLASDDGVQAFRTPLATLHKFQGWADKFLATPAGGIEDRYLGIAGKLGAVKFAATYHDFRADEGSLDYGTELNIVANYPLTSGINMQLKYADYNADDFATDTTKVWLTLNIAL